MVIGVVFFDDPTRTTLQCVEIEAIDQALAFNGIKGVIRLAGERVEIADGIVVLQVELEDVCDSVFILIRRDHSRGLTLVRIPQSPIDRTDDGLGVLGRERIIIVVVRRHTVALDHFHHLGPVVDIIIMQPLIQHLNDVDTAFDLLLAMALCAFARDQRLEVGERFGGGGIGVGTERQA